jgi:biotin carboxylase
MALLGARTNKWLQAQAFMRAGIDVVPQQTCLTVEEALTFAAAHGFRVWGKPLASAGGDGQFSADTPQKVEAGVRHILGTPNMYGQQNTGVLMMAWIQGATEEILDTCQLDGLTFIADRAVARKEDRNGFPAVFREVEILPIEDCDDLIALALKCHEAVGLRDGYAHGEFFRLPDGRLVPVEINYHRLPGVLPRLTAECRGVDPTAVMADASLDPERFRARYAEYGGRAPLLKAGRIVCLAADAAGRLAEPFPLAAVRSLPSYSDHWSHASSPGDPVHVTRDNQSVAGFVRLVHEDPGQVARDCGIIRELEPAMFRVA